MNMVKKTLEIEKKARYFQIGNAHNKVSTVWVVLHGYGMLSEFFIQKFNQINEKIDRNWLISIVFATFRRTPSSYPRRGYWLDSIQ